MKHNETAKTSLLIIAGIFTTVGTLQIQTDLLGGSILLLVAGIVLIVRGVLKSKNLI